MTFILYNSHLWMDRQNVVNALLMVKQIINKDFQFKNDR